MGLGERRTADRSVGALQALVHLEKVVSAGTLFRRLASMNRGYTPLHTLSIVLTCVPSSMVWRVKSISGTGFFW